MEICNDNGHGEICHSERYCPACSAIEDLEIKIRGLEDQNFDHLDTIFIKEKEIKNLEGEIEKLEEKLGAA